MPVPANVLRAVGASLILGAAVSACAAPMAAQDQAAASVQSTTAAANAPHPLTTLPGVRVGVQSTDLPTAPRTLPALPKARAAGTVMATKTGPTPVKVTSVDGCNRAYGTAAQCVPLVAPGGKAVDCAYLHASGLFDKPLMVIEDPLGLLKKKNAKRGTTPDGKNVTISACTD